MDDFGNSTAFCRSKIPRKVYYLWLIGNSTSCRPILSVKPWREGKCVTTKNHQKLFGDQTFWCLKPWPNGSNMFYQTSSNIRTQGVVATKLPRVFQHGGICDNASRVRELNMFNTPSQKKHDHQTNMRTKEMFDVLWSNLWNIIKRHQTSSNKVAKQ